MSTCPDRSLNSTRSSRKPCEAKRDDANFMYVSAWEYKGEDKEPELHKEPLKYEFIEVKTRNYKD